MAGRERAWADVRIVETLAGGASLLKNLLAGAPTVDTLTVVRLVVDLIVSADPTSEVEYDAAIDVGIGVTSSQAFATAGALPDLVTLDYPPRGWLYRATKRTYQALPTGGTPVTMWRVDAVFMADLRAMRKVDKGILYLEMSNTAILAATTMRVVGLVRALCLT